MLRFLFFFGCFFTLISNAQQSRTTFWAGTTTGSLPFLDYGLGTDRLGGAKMCLLDTGVVLKIVDSTVINYKAQLSQNHYAYIQKTNLKRNDKIKLQSYYLTESWMVNGDDTSDYINVSLPEKLPYRSIQQVNPSKLIIDIFGATSNTNWITQRQGAKEILNAYSEQIEDDVFRIIIDLKHSQHWGYTISYNGNNLIIKVKRQPANLALRDLKIAIDAGHGGSNSGARGVKSGGYEKVYTLLIAKKLEQTLLHEGAKVFMTRNADESLGMTERIKMLEKEKPDFLISIHLNSSGKDSVNGVSTYYRYIGFRPLTQYILRSMLELPLNEFGNVGNFNFALSGPTDYPNCLVEVAFLSNKEDEAKILQPGFQQDVAEKITEGIKAWLLECSKDNR